MILFFAVPFSVITIIYFGCGRNKKGAKKSRDTGKSPLKTVQPPPSSFPKVDPPKVENKVDQPSPKPEEQPKPKVEDTKVAEVIPDSEQVDEMKGGIKLPSVPNMKLESGGEAGGKKRESDEKAEIM